MSNPLDQKTSATTNSLNSSQVVVEKTRRGSSSVEAAAAKETSGNLLLLSNDSSSSTAVPPLPSGPGVNLQTTTTTTTTATTTRSNSTAHPQQQQQQQQHQPQSQKDFSLQVSYITSTSIFVPEISIAPNSATTISSSSTILHQLPSEDAPDQNLANIVGATSAAGSGLMVHIFRFVTNTDSDNNHSTMMRKRHSVVSNTNTIKSNNNYNHSEQPNTTHSSSSAALPVPPPPPPLVALLDEEEASNLRGVGSSSEVSPLKLEHRVMSIKKNVKSLRFLPDELDRFLHSASLDQEATDLIKKLVDSGQEQYLAAVAGVFVGKLPQLRIHSYEEGASFVKVLVR